MKTNSRWALIATHILLLGLLESLGSSVGRTAQAQGEVSSPTDFARAEKPRAFAFPRDHGSHPEFKTEWWYVTCALQSDAGEVFGCQATWFRTAMAKSTAVRTSKLAVRDLYIFHGALSDVSAKRFHFDEVASRGAADWAHSTAGALKVHVFQHSLTEEKDGSWKLRFLVQGRAVELELRPTRPPLLHGATPGLSQKGPQPGQASYYVSQTRLTATGTLQRTPGSVPVRVAGTAWFDHEFGSSQLDAEQIGWDWFSVTLDDGTDLMLYQIRKRGGAVEATSSGTLRTETGHRVHLKRGGYSIEVLDTWRSAASGGSYPSKWRLRIPAEELELEVTALMSDQELRTRRTTGVTYWEGLCGFQGTHRGRPVRGRGYVELVGYAGEFRRRI